MLLFLLAIIIRMVVLLFSLIFISIALVVVPTPTMIFVHVAITFAARMLSIVAPSMAALGANSLRCHGTCA